MKSQKVELINMYKGSAIYYQNIPIQFINWKDLIKLKWRKGQNLKED